MPRRGSNALCAKCVSVASVPIVLIGLCTGGGASAQEVIVSGAISKTWDVERKIKENQAVGDAIKLHFIKNREIGTIRDVEDQNKYKVTIPKRLVAIHETLIRAVHSKGFVSRSDPYLLSNSAEEASIGGTNAIQNVDLVITTVEDRFLSEMKTINKYLEQKDYFGALGLLDDVERDFMPSNSASYYRYCQKRIEVVYNALADNTIPHDRDLDFVFDFEINPLFVDMTADQKRSLYLQFGRALRQSPIERLVTADGKPLVSTIEHALSKAIYWARDRDLGQSSEWAVHKERADAWFGVKRYEKAFEASRQFFEMAHYPAKDLSDSQSRAVVQFLAVMGDSLALLSNRIEMREAKYIEKIRQEADLLNMWSSYAAYISHWSALFPSTSKNRISIRFNDDLSLWSDIQKSMS